MFALLKGFIELTIRGSQFTKLIIKIPTQHNPNYKSQSNTANHASSDTSFLLWQLSVDKTRVDEQMPEEKQAGREPGLRARSCRDTHGRASLKTVFIRACSPRRASLRANDKLLLCLRKHDFMRAELQPPNYRPLLGNIFTYKTK